MTRIFEKSCVHGHAEVDLVTDTDPAVRGFLLLGVRAETTSEPGTSSTYLDPVGARAMARVLNAWAAKQEKTNRAEASASHKHVMACTTPACPRCGDMFECLCY